jgi:hypothetical protein
MCQSCSNISVHTVVTIFRANDATWVRVCVEHSTIQKEETHWLKRRFAGTDVRPHFTQSVSTLTGAVGCLSTADPWFSRLVSPTRCATLVELWHHDKKMHTLPQVQGILPTSGSSVTDSLSEIDLREVIILFWGLWIVQILPSSLTLWTTVHWTYGM